MPIEDNDQLFKGLKIALIVLYVLGLIISFIVIIVSIIGLVGIDHIDTDNSNIDPADREAVKSGASMYFLIVPKDSR